MNAASHKYKDKRVKMSNQKYVDQMCDKKNNYYKKIVSYNNGENLKLLVKKEIIRVSSSIKYRLVYLQEKVPDMWWYFISHKFFSVKYILV